MTKVANAYSTMNYANYDALGRVVHLGVSSQIAEQLFTDAANALADEARFNQRSGQIAADLDEFAAQESVQRQSQAEALSQL